MVEIQLIESGMVNEIQTLLLAWNDGSTRGGATAQGIGYREGVSATCRIRDVGNHTSVDGRRISPCDRP